MPQLRILVVDDNRDICETLKDILELRGHRVTTAFDGLSALDTASRDSFDIVLLDIKMPGMDGLEALKRLKASHPDTPVVMLSAYATASVTKEARALGASSTLAKPVDIRLLLSVLEGGVGVSPRGVSGNHR